MKKKKGGRTQQTWDSREKYAKVPWQMLAVIPASGCTAEYKVKGTVTFVHAIFMYSIL